MHAIFSVYVGVCMIGGGGECVGERSGGREGGKRVGRTARQQTNRRRGKRVRGWERERERERDLRGMSRFLTCSGFKISTMKPQYNPQTYV